MRVVSITPETLIEANSAPSAPRSLPTVFETTAGGGGGLRGAGALPEPPVMPEQRPARMSLNPPPDFAPEPYKIGVGDVVLLSVPRNAALAAEFPGLLAAENARQGYTVQDDGAINVPDVGRVRIAGRTIEEAEADLFQRLVEAGIDPTFSLEISEFRSKRVSIGGAVTQPSVVPVTLTPLYLDEALAAAGGLNVEDPDFAAIRLYRDEKLYQIPLTDLFSQSGLRRTRLKDGDAIFVDAAFQLSKAQAYFEQQIRLAELRQSVRGEALRNLSQEIAIRREALEEARANYMAQRELGVDNRDYVYVSGEVKKQTRFALPIGGTASLADALYGEAGGVAQGTGDITQVYVLRAASDPGVFGAVTAWHLDSRNAATLALATRFELRPDDVVFVAEQPVTRWNRTITQILPQVLVSGGPTWRPNRGA
ncbi:polysaccharide export outer membrane protein [Rhodobacteraceae bacterium MBR-64]